MSATATGFPVDRSTSSAASPSGTGVPANLSVASSFPRHSSRADVASKQIAHAPAAPAGDAVTSRAFGFGITSSSHPSVPSVRAPAVLLHENIVRENIVIGGW